MTSLDPVLLLDSLQVPSCKGDADAFVRSFQDSRFGSNGQETGEQKQWLHLVLFLHGFPFFTPKHVGASAPLPGQGSFLSGGRRKKLLSPRI